MVYSCDDDPEPENLTLIDLQISVDSDTLLIKGGDKKTRKFHYLKIYLYQFNKDSD